MFLWVQYEIFIMQVFDDWISEIILFLLGFVLDIFFQGFEEFCFVLSWLDFISQEFWIYIFVWCFEGEFVMFIEVYLEEVLESYYDGLMGVVVGIGEVLEKVFCLVVQEGFIFVGKLCIYDLFFIRYSIIFNFSGVV